MEYYKERMEKYIVKDLIGEGKLGNCSLAEDRETHKGLVLKRISIDDQAKYERQAYFIFYSY